MYPRIDVEATGKRIRELRKARGLTVGQLADFLCLLSEQAVYKWQRGDSLPTVDNLYALSKLFGVSVDAILVGVAEKTKEKDEGPSLSVYSGELREIA